MDELQFEIVNPRFSRSDWTIIHIGPYMDHISVAYTLNHMFESVQSVDFGVYKQKYTDSVVTSLAAIDLQ